MTRLIGPMRHLPVYAVYAISSLDTGLPLRPRARIAVGTYCNTYQGVAGLAPRPFTLGEETGSHDMVMLFMLFMQLARSTLVYP